MICCKITRLERPLMPPPSTIMSLKLFHNLDSTYRATIAANGAECPRSWRQRLMGLSERQRSYGLRRSGEECEVAQMRSTGLSRCDLRIGVTSSLTKL